MPIAKMELPPMLLWGVTCGMSPSQSHYTPFSSSQKSLFEIVSTNA